VCQQNEGNAGGGARRVSGKLSVSQILRTSGKYGENYRGGAEGAGAVCAAAESLGEGRIFLRGGGQPGPSSLLRGGAVLPSGAQRHDAGVPAAGRTGGAGAGSVRGAGRKGHRPGSGSWGP